MRQFNVLVTFLKSTLKKKVTQNSLNLEVQVELSPNRK